MSGISKKVGDVGIRMFQGRAGRGAVVMIQEWWGITEQLELQAKDLRHKVGCTVVIPDLYEGKSTLEQEEANHMMSNLNWPKAVDRIEGLGKHLVEEDKFGKVAVMGFCMGGALAIASAVRSVKSDGSPLFACGIPFYGIPPKELADAAQVKIPMQGHFGLKDNMAGFSDPKSCDALEEAWKRAGIEYEMHRYPDVGHAFMNNLPHAVELKKSIGQIGDGPQDAKHDPNAIITAWERVASFLAHHGI